MTIPDMIRISSEFEALRNFIVSRLVDYNEDLQYAELLEVSQRNQNILLMVDTDHEGPLYINVPFEDIFDTQT